MSHLNKQAERRILGSISGAACGSNIGEAACQMSDQAPRTISATVDVSACHGFDVAFTALQQGHRVTRAGWNGKGQWLVRVRDWNGDFGGGLPPTWSARPFIAIGTADGAMTPWQPSQGDLFAYDWAILPR